MSIQFECHGCGKRYRTKDSNAGKKTKCSRCGEALTIPSADKAATDAADVDQQEYELAISPQEMKDQAAGDGSVSSSSGFQDYEEDDDSIEYDLDEPPFKPCPNCQERLLAEAKVCVHCGLDLITGEMIEQEEPPIPIDWRRGSIFAAAGAGIGTAVWTAAGCLMPQMDVSFLVILLGGLAGGGMMYGAQAYSSLTGVVPLALTLLGVLIAKAAIFGMVEVPQLNNQVGVQLVVERLPEEVQSQMSEAELLAKERELQNLAAGYVRSRLVPLFFSTMFPPLDGVYIPLALLLAYSIGSALHELFMDPEEEVVEEYVEQ